MFVPSLQFAAESSESGLGALGISGQAFLVQLVTFVLAFFILRRYAFKPIAKVLNDRRELIDNGVRLGEEMQKKQVELEATVSAELRKAHLAADGIIADANTAARQVVADAEEKARAKAEHIQADAHARAEQDVTQMRKALLVEVSGLVSDATEAIIDEKVDANKDAQLIDRALKGDRA